MTHAEPTAEQLQMAYRHLANPSWPPTLDEALARQAYRVAIYAVARNLGRPRWMGAPRGASTLPAGPVPPTPTAPPERAAAAPKRARYFPANAFDGRRAAANDRDD